MMHIGFIMPSIPNYSEIFILNKMEGLLNYGFKVSLFVASERDSKTLPLSIPIFYQVNIKNKFNLLFVLITTFISHPISCIRYLNLEKNTHDNCLIALKHLISNAHIICQPLDWLNFCFATAGIGRENLASAMGAKSAVSFRGFDIGLYPHQHPGCYELLWQKIDKVHTISDDLYKKAIELGLDHKTPFKKIPPAINAEFFRSDALEDIHKPLRILTVGRLHWKKGYEYALKALSLLKDKQINFEYRIIGEGNHREAILYAIHQLKLKKNVKVRGQLSHEDVKGEMEWADIYIQPSIQEGFCNAVLEAQAMGLLCIVTNAEGLSENVLDRKTGWVVPKRSPEAIAEQTINILNMKKHQYNNIRKNAIDRIKNHFQLDDQIKNWSKFYQND